MLSSNCIHEVFLTTQAPADIFTGFYGGLTMTVVVAKVT
jgi:hypothetical protein